MSALPLHLHAAYDWTAAAGELEELRGLTGDALDLYCAEAAANAAEHASPDVLASDLAELAGWLADPMGAHNSPFDVVDGATGEIIPREDLE